MVLIIFWHCWLLKKGQPFPWTLVDQTCWPRSMLPHTEAVLLKAPRLLPAERFAGCLQDDGNPMQRITEQYCSSSSLVCIFWHFCLVTYLVDECFSFCTNCKAITVVCHYSLMNCMLQEFKALLFRFAFHLRMKDLDKPFGISGLKSKKISLILLTLQKCGSDLRALIIGYQDCATYVGFWIISWCASSISRALILSLLGSFKHL